MNIWLPYANYRKCLDTLSDQHVDDIVVYGLDTLRMIWRGETAGRLARMWVTRPAALLAYIGHADREMVRRGQPAEPKVMRAHVALSRAGWPLAPVPPWWWGHPQFHRTQASNLIRIDPEWYAHRLPCTTPLDLKYWWPTEKENEFLCR